MNYEKEIRFIEMFVGIGGFRRGLEKSNNQNSRRQTSTRQNLRSEGNSTLSSTRNERQYPPSDENSGFRCVWANEINKYACKIYWKNFGTKELVEADIKTVNPSSIPDFDLLTAGFPCQAFSVAGKRKGFQDTRGTLFYDIVRVAEAKRPKLLLLENVKGLLSHDEGLTFQIIIESLEELGYLVEWQVLNSKHFGVPQNRERVFIIGHLRGESGCKIFPIGKNDGKTNGCIETAYAITANYWKGTTLKHYQEKHSRQLVQVGNVDTKGHNSLWGRVYSPEGLAPNLNAEGGGLGAKTGLIVQPCLTPDRANKRQHGRRFKENGEPMFTLTGQDIHGIALNQKIRRLTPVECERLQGFPDGWTEGISDTQRYKCLGNAVTTNVIEFLGRQLLSIM